MKDIGKVICNMDLGQKYTKTEIGTRVCLNRAKEMVKVRTIYSMELYIKVNGLMDGSKVREYVNGKMEGDIKVHGQITKNMDMVSIHGQMGEDTKDNTKTIKNMEWGLIIGQMVENMWANGKMIKGMDEGNTL